MDTGKDHRGLPPIFSPRVTLDLYLACILLYFLMEVSMNSVAYILSHVSRSGRMDLMQCFIARLKEAKRFSTLPKKPVLSSTERRDRRGNDDVRVEEALGEISGKHSRG